MLQMHDGEWHPVPHVPSREELIQKNILKELRRLRELLEKKNRKQKVRKPKEVPKPVKE